MDSTWTAIVKARERGENVAVATVIGVNGSSPRNAGARIVVWADGRIEGTVGGGNFEKVVIEAAVGVIMSGVPNRLSVHLTRDLGMCCGGAMEVFIEPVKPAEELVIFGAGHVAKPTAAFALAAGWEVRVVDERDEWATPDRFPGCTLDIRDPRRAVREIEASPQRYLLIVTHDHSLDQDLLESVIAKEFAWIGLIGSRAKITKFFLRLRAAGIDPALFSKVSAPVGLDLGAESPAEIGVSILAELVQVRRGRSGTARPMRLAAGFA